MKKRYMTKERLKKILGFKRGGGRNVGAQHGEKQSSEIALLSVEEQNRVKDDAAATIGEVGDEYNR